MTTRLRLCAAVALSAFAAVLFTACAHARTATTRAHAATTRAHAATTRAHAANTFMTGLGDEQIQMFSDPLWQQLNTKIARYIAPYDAALRPDSLAEARAWIEAAEAQHQQILIAF